jgi:hypothetical protein
MTVAELGDRMDSAELSWWLAKEAIDPIPDSYWQAALIASTVAQVMGSKKAKLEHFLPRRKPRGGAVGPAALAMIRALAERADRAKERG